MLIDLLYKIFTEYEGEPWKTVLATMVKLNPKERPSFSTIVEVLEKHLEASSSWSSSASGKASKNIISLPR
jgi:hypothetical protein